MDLRATMKKLAGAAAAAGAALTLSVGAAMAEYPERAITLIYPYPAGSATETTVRVMAEEASKILGQPIVVENREGAGGRVGAETLMNADPDGYTLAVINNTIAVNQVLMNPDLMFDIPGKIQPIMAAFGTPLAFVANKDMPFDDMKGMIDYAHEHPGELLFGTSGQGTGTHLSLALLQSMVDFDVTVVHYKGSAPSVTGMLSGEVNVFVIDTTAAQYIKEGQMKGLGLTSTTPWPEFFPGVQPLADQLPELANYEYASYQSISAPGGTPDEIVQKLNEVFNQVLETDAVKEKLAASGQIGYGGSVDDMVKRFQKDRELWKPVIEKMNN